MGTYYDLDTTKYAEFAVAGTVFRRGNADGTAVTSDRLMTRGGTVDLTEEYEGIKLVTILGSSPVTSAKGTVGIGIDGVHYVIELDFVDAVDLEAVTQSEIRTALNTGFDVAGIDDILDAEVNANGICNIEVKSGETAQYIEVFGYLAGALGFGGGKAFRSLGSFYRNYLTDDDTISCVRSEQKTDNTNVDQTGGGKNTLTRVTLAGKRTGVSYEINVKPRDLILRQMFEGGRLAIHKKATKKPKRYELSSSNELEGMIEMYRLATLYPANKESKEGQEVGVVVEHVMAGLGTVGDATTGAMQLSSFNYTLEAGGYTDANGVEYEQPVELEYSKSLWLNESFVKAVSNGWTLEELEA